MHAPQGMASPGVWAALLLVTTCLSAGPSRAEEREPDLLRRAERAFAAGDFEEALTGFEAAYSGDPLPALLYNIGMCQWELDRAAAAVNSFRRYLEEASPSPSVEERLELERIIDELGPRHGDLIVEVSPEGAELLVDGAAVGRAPLSRALAVEPGEHELTARAEGFEPASATERVEAGQSVTVRLRLPPSGEAPAGGEAQEPTPPPGRPRPPWWLWASLGLCGASAIAMTATGALTLERHEDYQAGGLLDVDLYESGTRLGAVTDALLGVTLAAATALVVAVIVHAVRSRRAGPPAVDAAARR